MTNMQDPLQQRKNSDLIVLFPPDDGDDDEHDVLSPQLRNNFEVLKKRQSRDNDVEDNDPRKSEQLAIETAMLVQAEMDRLHNSIAELERLLNPSATDQPRPKRSRCEPSQIVLVEDEEHPYHTECHSAESSS